MLHSIRIESLSSFPFGGDGAQSSSSPPLFLYVSCCYGTPNAKWITVPSLVSTDANIIEEMTFHNPDQRKQHFETVWQWAFSRIAYNVEAM